MNLVINFLAFLQIQICEVNWVSRNRNFTNDIHAKGVQFFKVSFQKRKCKQICGCYTGKKPVNRFVFIYAKIC